jgi:hypothetical protein
VAQISHLASAVGPAKTLSVSYTFFVKATVVLICPAFVLVSGIAVATPVLRV